MAPRLQTGGTVLVCEPNDDVRELLVRVLGQLGFEPIVFEPRRDLPEVTAIVVEPAAEEFHEALRRAAGQGPLPPIVCVSIFAPEERPNGLPVAAHVAKPFTVRQLARGLAKALDAAG
jgi:hypothetical protein